MEIRQELTLLIIILMSITQRRLETAIDQLNTHHVIQDFLTYLV